MTRLRIMGLLATVAALISTLFALTPAHANVSALVLHTRTCGTVDAFIVYDTFSEGNPPFYAVFALDLNGNGVFGEVGEPTRYVRVTPGTGQSQFVGAHLAFKALPEGSIIAMTAYEVDSAGVPVSPQISPVAYECSHRPAKDPLPPNTDLAIPGVGIVAKINVYALTVYSDATVKSNPLGGLARGETANVLARNLRGDWLQIDFKGQVGWIMWQTQVILFGPYAELPVLPNAESATPVPATLTPTPHP